MTESAFPFGTPEGDAADAGGEATPSQDRNRRLLLVVAGAAGVLVLVAAAYFLFLKSDTAEEVAAPVVPARTTAPAAAAKDKAAEAVKQAVPRTFDDVVTRDPFIPLVKEPQVDPAAAAVAGAGAGPAAGSAGTGVAAQRTAATGVKLVDVYKKGKSVYAKTRVDGRAYDVKVGDTFGSYFMLLSADGKTATYLQGDEQFTLAEGQSVLR